MADAWDELDRRIQEVHMLRPDLTAPFDDLVTAVKKTDHPITRKALSRMIDKILDPAQPVSVDEVARAAASTHKMLAAIGVDTTSPEAAGTGGSIVRLMSLIAGLAGLMAAAWALRLVFR